MAQELSVLIDEIVAGSENEAQLRASLQHFQKQHPGLVEAMDAMNISYKEYLAALAAMNPAVSSSANTTGPGL